MKIIHIMFSSVLNSTLSVDSHRESTSSVYSRRESDGDVKLNMTSQEMMRETQVVKRCQREQFYQLVRNEPSKYLYLVKTWPECRDYVAREFSFLMSEFDKLMKVEISVKGEYPVVFTNEEGDRDLADDVSLYVTAKLNERSMSHRLPKRRQNSDTGSVIETHVCPIQTSNLEIIERLKRIELMLTQLVNVQ